MADEHYKKPGWFTRNMFNATVALATRLGMSIWGSRILQVQGRKTGQPRETPVNLLTHQGETYLVAPRGITQWVRNLRAAGKGTLRVGRHVDSFRAQELPDSEKPDVLRAYLRRWKMEVGVFFDGVDANSSDQELLRIAPDHPVFRIAITAA
jgi:deazaflavin-dependent oxidoreductase (nitroreductase family)